jgi:hypothetical protein
MRVDDSALDPTGEIAENVSIEALRTAASRPARLQLGGGGKQPPATGAGAAITNEKSRCKTCRRRGLARKPRPDRRRVPTCLALA